MILPKRAHGKMGFKGVQTYTQARSFSKVRVRIQTEGSLPPLTLSHAFHSLCCFHNPEKLECILKAPIFLFHVRWGIRLASWALASGRPQRTRGKLEPVVETWSYTEIVQVGVSPCLSSETQVWLCLLTQAVKVAFQISIMHSVVVLR